MKKVYMGLIAFLGTVAVLMILGGLSYFFNSKEGYVLLFLIIVALAYFIVSMLEGKVSRETNYVFAILIIYAILVLVGIIPPFRTRIGSLTTPTVMLGFIFLSIIFAVYLVIKGRNKRNQEID